MDRANPPQPHSPTDRPSPRDVQRAALHDLVTLATESAATESQIERQLHADTDAAVKEFERLAKSIDDKFKQVQKEIRQRHQEKAAAAAAQYEESSRALRQNDEAARRRIEHDYSRTERDIKEKYEQATWLADSVYEANDRQAHEDAKKAKDEVETHLKSVEERETEALNLMNLWGQKPPAVEPPPEKIEPPQGEARFATEREAIERNLVALKSLRLPRLFVGLPPYVLVLLLLGLVGAITHLRLGTPEPQFRPIGVAVGSTLGVILVLGFILRFISNRKVRDRYIPLARSIQTARLAAGAQLEHAQALARAKIAEAKAARDAEVQSKKERYAPLLTQARTIRDTNLREVQNEFTTKTAALEQMREKVVRETTQWLERKLADLQHRFDADQKSARESLEGRKAQIRQRYEEARGALERRLRDGLANIQTPIDNADGQAIRDWTAVDWTSWSPPMRFPNVVPFGQLAVDLRQIAERVPKDHPLQLKLPDAFAVPASLAFPRQASLLIQTDRTGRDAAIRTARTVMTRLLTSLPPGRVRFTLIDPVGLGQSFAAFMHLADHDEALVGGRIWTETDHILQRLTDLTEHMETVIQKYLRNEYETIDEYNAQAGELAEPYRYLVIADFPAGFEDEAARRLASIVSTGSRCGVYTIIVRDTREPVPSSLRLEELESHAVNLVQQDGAFVWKDSVFEQFPLTIDAPPNDETLTSILDAVGRHAKEAKRVEVPFDNIVPTDDKFWSGDSAHEIVVPMGRTGATRLQSMRLGRGVAQHVLIAGKTGSGKSTLLHAMVTNLAMWYAPDQVEFYLIDFKKGVEFKTYATHNLPHARAIAVESDREFGLSVLQRLDAELTRRGNLFRKLGVQDLAAYREALRSGTDDSLPQMPRTLLMIDEFQEFFSEDDKLAQDAGILLDRLVRQGRAFGIHVLLGSQTIGGTSGLARSTIGQMAVRVALQTSEADSQLILGDSNSAARLLSRPGEAIYNDQGGLVEGNSPFQIAWLPDEQRERYLAKIQSRTNGEIRSRHPAAIVFEGNAPADISKNARLAAMMNGRQAWSPGAPALGYVGEPVAIKDPTAVPFKRQSGSNLLIIGQYDDAAMALLSSAMISLAAQQPHEAAKFYVLDGSAADSPLARVLPHVKETIPHDVKMIDYRAVPDAINDLHEEMTRRQSNDSAGTQDSALPSIYVVIYALQRYRALRKQEDSFGSFSMDESEKKPQPDKQFADLLREGPALGIHVLAWADTPASVDRTFDRTTMREFDHRILFQMSANDSSNLIDSPAANKLGLNRALAYSEEQGTLEKFRPYALPDADFLARVKDRLAARTTPASAS